MSSRTCKKREDNPWTLKCLHMAAFLIHLAGPLCIVWTAYRASNLVNSWTKLDRPQNLAQELRHWLIESVFPIITTFSVLLEIWVFTEAVFFFFCLKLRDKMQRYVPADDFHMPEDLQEKLEVMRVILAGIKDPFEFLGGWFIEGDDATPIRMKPKHLYLRFKAWIMGSHRSQLGRLASAEKVKRENIREWISWAFLDISLQEAEKSHKVELNALFDEFERAVGIKFKEGMNSSIASIRLNLDPIRYLHKPLAFYTAIFVMDCFKDAFLTGIFFRRPHLSNSVYLHRGTMAHQLRLLLKFPFKLLYNTVHSLYSPFAPAEGNSLLGKLTPLNHLPKDVHPNVRFWYYENNSTVHLEKSSVKTRGRKHQLRVDVKLGNGSKSPSFPIVLVHGLGPGLTSYTKFIVRMRQLEPQRPILVVELPFLGMRINAMVPSIQQIVQSIASMLQRLGHSQAVFVGHSLGTAVVTWMMRYTDLVAGCVMFDPIVFNVFQPTLAYSFFHRKPKTVPEYLLRYMVSRELFTSFFISRHFRWRQNLCLPHYFPKTVASTCHVFLSSNDHLIEAASTLDYLRQRGIPVTMFKGLEHAEVLLYQKLESLIASKIQDCAAAAENHHYHESSKKNSAFTTLSQSPKSNSNNCTNLNVSEHTPSKRSPIKFQKICRSDSGFSASA